MNDFRKRHNWELRPTDREVDATFENEMSLH